MALGPGVVGPVGAAHAESPSAEAAPPVPAEETAAAQADPAVAAIVETEGGLQVVPVDAEPHDAAAVVTDLERDPDVVDAFVDVPATIADAHRSEQWNIDALDLDAVPASSDGSGTLVAVVDTGVDATHPDLAGRVDCRLGADFTVTSLRSVGDGCADPHGHGTHVAGIVSAVSGNGLGVAGVSAARIMPVRVLDAMGAGMVSRINAGIIWAVDHGAEVVNLSIVSNQTDAYDTAIRYALAHDVVVVAAAGNNRERGDSPQSPASTPGVIAVAATDDQEVSAPFSYSGPTNLVSAPGVDILSTAPGGGYAWMSGTSMAAPHVAGVLARYRALRPGVTEDRVRARVRATAIDIETPGRDDDTGYGLIGAHELLTAAEAPGPPRIGTPNAGPGAARVRWSAPASTGGSPITGYVVKAYQGWTKVRQVTVPATAREVRLAGLTNGRAHTFVVQAVNAVGTSPHSARSIPVTPRQAPSAPWVGRPVARNDAARVYWTAPKSNGGAYVSAYVVKIYQGTRGLRSVTVSGRATNALITGLGNRGYYSFTVTAKNAVGLGAPSARSATVRTT